MQDVQKGIAELEAELKTATARIGLRAMEKRLEELNQAVAKPDLWSDNVRAQAAMKEQARLQARVTPWQQLLAEVQETKELAATGDETLAGDLQKQLEALQKTFERQKDELKLSGEHDSDDAILSIHAGAGGTDAQDWAGMLLRMYVRWAESAGYTITTIEQSPGEEAGLKSVTLEISGNFAYGRLKGEHGVHRLVRLSPFNADNLRQTSFAKVEVLPKIDTPGELEIDEKDVKIDVFRAGGHGGQSVNTTDSAVRVTHIPTGISVAIQNERSQLQNKETALTILRSKLAQLKLEQHKERLDEIKGPNEQAAWGNQIRSYVLHPYTMVKDLRTRHETSDVQAVLDGSLDSFIDAYLEANIGEV